MITPLYRLAFKPLLKRGLKQKFRYFNAGKSLSTEEAQEVISLNQPYYEQKLEQELDLAFEVLKVKTPWLNALSWAFLISVLVCVGSLMLSSLGDWLMAVSLAAGAMSFGIVIWLLLKYTNLLNSTLSDSLGNTPAASMAIQIPICLIQVQLAFGLLVVGSFTHNISSFISGTSLLAIAVITQYTAMINFITRLEMRSLDSAGVREFMQKTAPLYSRASKAWLLSESMEGANISVGILQAMQGKDRAKASEDLN